MPRLSILIPALGGAEPLEATLVSVLENRPAACEVVVVTRQPYDDPYQLAGEVRFLTAPEGAGPVECIWHGLARCHAPLVHVLRAGGLATEGWTDAALAHFDDLKVAAVAPLVVDCRDHGRVVSAGLDYHAGGRTMVRAAGEAVDSLPSAAQPIVGPSLAAAFYRLDALHSHGDQLDARLGIEMAGVDWALSLREAGYASLFEPRSRVVLDAHEPESTTIAQTAWQAERLFWRHAGAIGWSRSLVAHVSVVVGDCAANWRSPRAIVNRLAGLLVGCGGAMLSRKRAKRPLGLRPEEIAASNLPSAPPRTMRRTDVGDTTTPPPRRETIDRAHENAHVA